MVSLIILRMSPTHSAYSYLLDIFSVNVQKAGEFAKRINAKTLIMNPFNARYKGDQSVKSITILTRMECQAMKASGLSDDSVAAAWDFMVLPIRQASAD